MTEKRLHSVGKYQDPEDRAKPYWVKVCWFDGHPPVQQPISEGEFFMLLGRIFAKHGPIMLDVGLGPAS